MSTFQQQLYRDLLSSALELLDRDAPPVSNMANISAFIRFSLPEINWAGFYLLNNGVLMLGPFCGQPACLRIPLGKGVCGTAAAKDQTVVVPDVHAFPGHIACDSASSSEIVIPLHMNGAVIGVLDIDSPVFSRFSDTEKEFFEEIAGALEATIAFDHLQYSLC